MTEREFFEQCIPQIADLAIEVKKLTVAEYHTLKEIILNEADIRVIDFMRKVFIVIEKSLSAMEPQFDFS